MNPQNNLVKQGETVVQSDPNNAWIIVDSGTRRIMRTRAVNGQVGEQDIPQTPAQSTPQAVPPTGAYQQSKTAKVLQETAEVAGVVGLATGLAGTLKGLFGKK